MLYNFWLFSDNVAQKAKGEGSGKGKSVVFQNETPEPCYLSSSIYYGGQENYSPRTKNSEYQHVVSSEFVNKLIRVEVKSMSSNTWSCIIRCITILMEHDSLIYFTLISCWSDSWLFLFSPWTVQERWWTGKSQWQRSEQCFKGELVAGYDTCIVVNMWYCDVILWQCDKFWSDAFLQVHSIIRHLAPFYQVQNTNKLRCAKLVIHCASI